MVHPKESMHLGEVNFKNRCTQDGFAKGIDALYGVECIDFGLVKSTGFLVAFLVAGSVGQTIILH